MPAADAAVGRNVWVGIGKQAAFDTPVAPTKFFEVTELTGVLPEYDYKKSSRRVGTRFAPVGTKSKRRVPIKIKVELNAENVGLLLTLGMGSDAVSAAGSAYKHTISLIENLPYFTAWCSTDLIADADSADTIHQIRNCKVVAVNVDVTVDDVILISIDAIGTANYPAYVSKSGISATGTTGNPNLSGFSSVNGLVPGMTVTGTNVGAAAKILSVDYVAKTVVLTVNNTGSVSSITVAAPSPTFPTSRSLWGNAEESQAKLEIGAAVGSLADFLETNEFHLSITNGVAADYRLDNTASASSLREGDSQVSGNFKAMYNRNTWAEVRAFQAGTRRALRFTATSSELAATGQPYKMTITTDKAAYSGAPPSWDPDVITIDGQFDIEKTTSYPIIEIINADSAAY